MTLVLALACDAGPAPSQPAARLSAGMTAPRAPSPSLPVTSALTADAGPPPTSKRYAPKAPRLGSIPKFLPAVSRKSLAQYRTKLHDDARVEAAVRAADGTALVVYSIKGTSGLWLAELQTTPPLVKRLTATTLECTEGDQCATRLIGYEVQPGSLALLAVMTGHGSRGQGYFDTSQAELWMLIPEGFAHPVKLPEADSSTTAHGVVEQSTDLHWVDTDGEGAAGMLVVHRNSSSGTLIGSDTLPGWNRRSYELLAFDAARGTYERVEIAAETPERVMQRLARSAAFAGY